MLPGLCMCACSGLFMCTCEVMVVHTFMSTASSHRQFMLLVKCESVSVCVCACDIPRGD